MFDSNALNLWYKKLGIKDETKIMIDRIRSSPPSRSVGSNGKNVPGKYTSKKMGCSIQFESHKVELPIIYQMEHNDECVEFYDQPPPIKLNYIYAKTGRAIGTLHTPDFFVLFKEWAGWIECKQENDLIILEESNPNRYYRDEKGDWRCPPGEEYANEFGLSYNVISSSSINNVFYRNILFLEDYLLGKPINIEQEECKNIISLVNSHSGISVLDLIQNQTVSPDMLYSLIAIDEVYVNLYDVPLSEAHRAFVYANKVIAAALTLINQPPNFEIKSNIINDSPGTIFVWDGKPWTIVNSGNNNIAIMDTDKNLAELSFTNFTGLIKKGHIICSNNNTEYGEKAKEIILKASLEDLKKANKICDIIKISSDSSNANDISPRTLRFWKTKYCEAEKLYGYGYLGLLPQNYKKGNRNPRFQEDLIEFMKNFIKMEYENGKNMGKFEVYGLFLKACEKKGFLAPSYRTFASYINNRPKYDQTVGRKGKRAAYLHEEFYWELEFTTPRHGDRPFEIAHIDHTELDIELIHSSTYRNLGKPWVTFLSDAYSRRILAFYLTFDSPSYRSCMMTLRECVRLYNRLPQTIVMDGGKEFHSIYFESLLAFFRCTKKVRPSAKPRYGSVCERLFGTVNTQFVHNLIGNTQLMKNVRTITKSNNPKNNAIWTFEQLYNYLCLWITEVHDCIEHPSLGQSPKEAFDSGIALSGQRLSRFINYDDNFLIMTMPTTKKGRSKVISCRGVKINNKYYWNNLFRKPEIENTEVPVRYDPFDVGIAYAYIGKQWVQSFSEQYPKYKGRTEKEIFMATQELKKQLSDHNKNKKITAKKIADYLESVQAQERLLLQRMQDAEVRNVYTIYHNKSKKEPAITELQVNKDNAKIINIAEKMPLESYEEF